MSDIAHLGPVELFTPKGEDSLRFELAPCFSCLRPAMLFE